MLALKSFNIAAEAVVLRDEDLLRLLLCLELSLDILHVQVNLPDGCVFLRALGPRRVQRLLERSDLLPEPVIGCLALSQLGPGHPELCLGVGHP